MAAGRTELENLAQEGEGVKNTERREFGFQAH